MAWYLSGYLSYSAEGKFIISDRIFILMANSVLIVRVNFRLRQYLAF